MTRQYHKRPGGSAATLIALPLILTLLSLIPFRECSATPAGSRESSSPHSAVHQETLPGNNPCDLPSLVELALANNPRTRAGWFKAVEAGTAVGQAKAPYYPKATLSVTGGYDSGYNPIQTGPETYSRVSVNPGIQMEYLLLDFGRRSADLQRANALLQAADLDYNRQVQATVFAVQQSYFAHMAALSQQEAAATNLEFARTLHDMVLAQKSSGLATDPDLLMAEKTLSQAQFDMASAHREVEVTLGNLRTVSGMPANAPLKVAQPTGKLSLQTLSANVDRLVDTALLQRPDLAARVADIRASQASTRRALAEFLPKVSLQGSYTSQNYGYSAALANVSGNYNGSFNAVGGFAVLSWDLFDGYERVSKVKKRAAEEAEASAKAEEVQLTATRDVWTAYHDSLKAGKAVDYAEAQNASAKENKDSTQAAFQNGLATITEVIASQNALATARFEQARANADYLTSIAALSLAMGQIPSPGGKPTFPAPR